MKTIKKDSNYRLSFFLNSPPFGDRLGGIATYILHRAHILSKHNFTIYWTDGFNVALFDYERREWEIVKEYKTNKLYRIKKRYTHLLPGIKYLIDEIKIDIIEFPDSYGYDISKLKEKCEIIIQCHTSSPVRDFLNDLPFSLRAKFNAKRIRKNLLNASKVLACSYEIALLTAGFYKIHLDKFNILPHAFSAELLPISLDNHNKSDNYFITVANVEYLKGIDLLLTAFIEYKKRGGKSKLYYIGPIDLFDVPSPMKERWIELGTDKLIEQLNKDDFAFVPYLKKEKVLELMSNAAATIVLSRFEAFTMVVGEAASIGCPLVISNKLGWNNLINRFDAGILVNPYDKYEVAEAILTIEDRNISTKYSLNIQQLNQYLNSDLLINKTINEYRIC